MSSRKFYVYCVFDEAGIPRYIGKGHGLRYIRSIGRSKNPIIRSKLLGTKYVSKIIIDNLSEEEAFHAEIIEISRIGRIIDGNGSLYNLTVGGEGYTGHEYSLDDIVKRYKQRREFELENRLTGEVRKFVSLGHASRELGVSTVILSQLLHGKCKTVLKKTWKIKGAEISHDDAKKKTVSLLDTRTNTVHTFKSRTEAVKALKISTTSLAMLFKGKQKIIAKYFTIAPSSFLPKYCAHHM